MRPWVRRSTASWSRWRLRSLWGGVTLGFRLLEDAFDADSDDLAETGIADHGLPVGGVLGGTRPFREVDLGSSPVRSPDGDRLAPATLLAVLADHALRILVDPSHARE